MSLIFRLILLLWLLIPVRILGGLMAQTDLEPLPRIPPREPGDAAASFQLRPGFRIELVASEPLIRDPVAIEFDEDGNLYVAEFPEYNQYVNPGFTERGCVKKLVDSDGDGRYDQATLFADAVDAPVALACWDGGVFVGSVPDLWYFKDTTGDGKANIREKILTGFEKDRAGEAMLNSFRWGIDNRLLISTSLAGGTLRRADRPEIPAISVRRQNIRFDPRTRKVEPTSGGGQHGMTLDDWGNTFVCDNSNPIEYLSYDGRYLVNNPYVVAPSAVVDVNAAGRYPKLNRISPPEPWREARTRLRAAKLVPGSDEGGQPFGFFTGATGVTVYRGDAFPQEFHGDIFVGEVANNLVYRAKPRHDGLRVSAIRAEEGREFLASRDVWFRPVQFANAPDGCLYIVDMYRELIEGAAFLPPQLLKFVDVAGGINRGRIWRVIPDGAARRPTPKLSQATSTELVALLEHANGWHRDTAARLLTQRNDSQSLAEIRRLAGHSEKPLARTHARYLLATLGSLTVKDVAGWLEDGESHAREHALRIAEPLAKDPAIVAAMARLIDDPHPRVRLQTAFSLGFAPASEAAPLLARLATRDGHEPLVRLGILCSAHDCAGDLLGRLLNDPDYRAKASSRLLLTALTAQIGAASRNEDLLPAMAAINTLPESERALTRELVLTIISKLHPKARATLAEKAGPRAAAVLAEAIASARATAMNEKASPNARVAAIQTLTLAPFKEIRAVLTEARDFRLAPPVESAALAWLARIDDPAVPGMILSGWASMSPSVRATAIEALLSRPAWVQQFLDAVEHKQVRPADIDPARVQLLLKSSDATIRTRAETLFASAGLSRRSEVITRYAPALQMTGDPIRGKVVFKNHCSACHKLEGVGNSVGPDLASIKNRGSESVLTNILDPNREVLPQYLTYLVTTDVGTTVTGMITAETANTVTLRKSDGSTETMQRVNIEQMRSTGLSAMPEGLEQQVPLPAMADLLAYLNSIK